MLHDQNAAVGFGQTRDGFPQSSDIFALQYLLSRPGQGGGKGPLPQLRITDDCRLLTLSLQKVEAEIFQNTVQ